MKSVLEELWYGNICPSEKCYKITPETKKLTGELADYYEVLNKSLTKEQKEELENFANTVWELTDINVREAFVYGFRLGLKIAVEGMSFSE